MKKQNWCEHDEKLSKYTYVKYQYHEEIVTQRIQSWWCPECGLHGAESDIIKKIQKTDGLSRCR